MKEESSLIRNVTNHLDQTLQTLDPEICFKIQASRSKALDQRKRKQRPYFYPATALVSALTILVTGAWFFLKSPEPDIGPDQLEIVELLTSDQQLEFYENIEFYTRLSEHPADDTDS